MRDSREFQQQKEWKKTIGWAGIRNGTQPAKTTDENMQIS